jgi:hypothetical protein
MLHVTGSDLFCLFHPPTLPGPRLMENVVTRSTPTSFSQTKIVNRLTNVLDENKKQSKRDIPDLS